MIKSERAGAAAIEKFPPDLAAAERFKAEAAGYRQQLHELQQRA
jgi:hypothetical protein